MRFFYLLFFLFPVILPASSIYLGSDHSIHLHEAVYFGSERVDTSLSEAKLLVDLSVIYLQKATVPVVVSTPRVSTAAFLEIQDLTSASRTNVTISPPATEVNSLQSNVIYSVRACSELATGVLCGSSLMVRPLANIFYTQFGETGAGGAPSSQLVTWPTGAYSVEIYIKPVDFAQWSSARHTVLVSVGNNAQPDILNMFYSSGNGMINVKAYGNHIAAGGSSPTTGEWQHVVYTFDGSMRTLFVNGVINYGPGEHSATLIGGSVLLSNVYDITSLSSADSVTYSPTSGTQYGLLNVYEHMMTADEVLERYNSLSTCDATLPSTLPDPVISFNCKDGDNCVGTSPPTASFHSLC